MNLGKSVRQISANQPLSDWIRQVIDRRETLWFFVWRDLKVQYQQPIFGLLWSVFQPLVYFGVILLLRSTTTSMTESEMPFELYLISGLVFWNFTTSAVNGAIQSIQSNAGLISKSYFPKFYLILAPLLKSTLDLFVMFLIVLAFSFYLEQPLNGSALLFIPLALIMLWSMVLGCSAIAASAVVHNRHVRHAIPVLLYALIFALPVFYPMGKMNHEALNFLYMANPIAGAMDCFRTAFGGQVPAASSIGSWAVQAVIWLCIGIVAFRMTEKTLADKV